MKITDFKRLSTTPSGYHDKLRELCRQKCENINIDHTRVFTMVIALMLIQDRKDKFVEADRNMFNAISSVLSELGATIQEVDGEPITFTIAINN